MSGFIANDDLFRSASESIYLSDLKNKTVSLLLYMHAYNCILKDIWGKEVGEKLWLALQTCQL